MSDWNDELNPVDAEQYLVRLLLNTSTSTLREEALRLVDPDAFHSATLGGIWAAARTLLANDRPITRRTLVAEAERDGRSVEHSLDRLGAVIPSPGYFSEAVGQVNRCGEQRRLVEAADRIRQYALSGREPSEALARAHDELSKLDGDQSTSDTVSYRVMMERFDEAMRAPERAYTTIPTPWPELNDRMAGGLHGGRLYIPGARPGDGKSILAHNLAEHAAERGHPALVFSVEMGKLEVTGRMVSSGAKIEKTEIDRRSLTAASWSQFDEYRNRAADYPLYINDRPKLTLSYVQAECRAQKRRSGLDLVVVDYLQLLDAERGTASREQQVAHISRTLKQLARELDAAVVVPAQLNRQAVARTRPSLADLRESGGIEADADCVLLMSRIYVDAGGKIADATTGQPNGMIAIDLAKNRHGRTDSVELAFRGHYARLGA